MQVGTVIFEWMLLKNKNIKLLVNYGIGPLLFCWLAFSICKQVAHQPNLHAAISSITASITGPQSWKIWLAAALVPLNWGIEARKWQVLVKRLEPISLFTALKAVLAGLAFSMNTPNRIGEFGGRMMYIHEGHRWKAFALSIVAGYSQLMVTLLMGMTGMSFVLLAPVHLTADFRLWLRIMFYGTAIVSLLLLVLYLRLAFVTRWIDRLPGADKYAKHLATIEALPVTILLRTISLSFLRYFIFVFQYILFLQLFGVDAAAFTLFWLIGILYLVLAVIPTIALAEAGIRGQVSLLLFSLVSNNKLGIVGAATSIWFLNLVLPAIPGSILFLRLKIFQDK